MVKEHVSVRFKICVAYGRLLLTYVDVYVVPGARYDTIRATGTLFSFRRVVCLHRFPPLFFGFRRLVVLLSGVAAIRTSDHSSATAGCARLEARVARGAARAFASTSG